MELHHIGVITPDLAMSQGFYEFLGYCNSGTFLDEIQGVEIALMESVNNPTLIELIFPYHEDSPARQWLKRIKAGSYHTCYSCQDLELTLKDCEAQGVIQISEISPAIAFNHRRVVFLWAQACGLFELLEK